MANHHPNPLSLLGPSILWPPHLCQRNELTAVDSHRLAGLVRCACYDESVTKVVGLFHPLFLSGICFSQASDDPHTCMQQLELLVVSAYHPTTKRTRVSHVVEGGPVYVSDTPTTHDAAVLRQVAFYDGKCLFQHILYFSTLFHLICL